MSDYKFPHPPLKRGYNKLRTAGLRSSKSATFGMVRKNADGSPRPHQGVDLAIPNNYRVYAVDHGKVVDVSKGLNGYGWTITIKLDKSSPTNLYAFYAHLSDIRVYVGQRVTPGMIIGLTGSTGNAKGMTTESRGAHLHFEVRYTHPVGRGLSGRMNPLDYFDLDA